MVSRGILFVLVCLLPAALAWACPFCDAPSITYSEQLKGAPAAILVKWATAEKSDPFNFTPGSTTYQVVTAFRQPEKKVTSGESIRIPFYQSGEPGDSFWMLGNVIEGQFDWAPPTAMSAECWKYVVNAPSRERPQPERLRYYLPFLEHSDPDIAIDAYGEFAGAPYEEILALREDLPREKILHWLTDPEITPSRRGLYGLMLGLCGKAEDGKRIEPILMEKPEHPRLGIDGMMAGYILLTGEQGFQKLVGAKLIDPEIIPGESFAMLQTLRFLWEYAPHAVPRAAMIGAMHRLLDHPQYAGAAIIDLARWQHWDTTPELTRRYGQGLYTDRHIKEAVIRFLLLAAQAEKETPAVQNARVTLKKLRQTDEDLIKSVERRNFD